MNSSVTWLTTPFVNHHDHHLQGSLGPMVHLDLYFTSVAEHILLHIEHGHTMFFFYRGALLCQQSVTVSLSKSTIRIFFNHLSLIWSQRFSLSQTLSSDCFINGLLQQTLTTTLRLAYLFDHSMYKNNSLYFLIIVAVFNSNITINFILTFYWKCHHSEPVKKKMAHFSI